MSDKEEPFVSLEEKESLVSLEEKEEAYLNISISNAMIAYKAGATWSDEHKAWKTTTKEMYEILAPFVRKKESLCHIPEEQRDKYKGGLPIGRYYTASNPANVISKKKYEFIYYRSGRKCEACHVDIKDTDYYPTAFGDYNENLRTFKFAYYLALCRNCNMYSGINLDRNFEVMRHECVRNLAKINGITENEVYDKLVDIYNKYIEQYDF